MTYLKTRLSLLFIVCIASCSCPEMDDADPCLEHTLSAFKLESAAKTIKQQSVNGELHYWLNTDAIQYDGAEYIINGHCDTVCYFCGECAEPSCLSNYDNSKWETIWIK